MSVPFQNIRWAFQKTQTEDCLQSTCWAVPVEHKQSTTWNTSWVALVEHKLSTPWEHKHSIRCRTQADPYLRTQAQHSSQNTILALPEEHMWIVEQPIQNTSWAICFRPQYEDFDLWLMFCTPRKKISWKNIKAHQWQNMYFLWEKKSSRYLSSENVLLVMCPRLL